VKCWKRRKMSKCDIKLMDEALQEFVEKGMDKFKKGIQEHNPNGDKGITRMKFIQKVDCIKEEIIDLWFYACALEKEKQDEM
jgi:hypothetical protein